MASPRNKTTSLEEKLVKLGLNKPTTESSQQSPTAPLFSAYNDRIRPLLDAIDRLRHLKVMKEGIELPTIVVVGDQSSGKSSVLESLAGINLPRGQGICTRVPLIMLLQDHTSPTPQLHLEYNGKIVPTDETHVAEAINIATLEIAGHGKAISYTPLTLLVKKKGVPDLTLVDLPGITRVPIHGQPQDIYEQISGIIMEYISPRETIILNVLSATVDFPTCDSIRMSQRVDKNGERTLAVVTKCDIAPEGLLEKVIADDVKIGLGYVCVRNRVGDESYEEARGEEARLFESHPLLSRIDKSMVGIPVLAQKLVQLQAIGIKKCMPDIVKKINDKLNLNVSALNKLPQKLSTVPEAMIALMRIVGLAKESLRKILLRGEYDEYPYEKDMHCSARMADMLGEFWKDLRRNSEDSTEGFLMEEIGVLEEAKAIELPNFLPRSAFHAILYRKVKEISNTPVEFVEKVWSYIEEVVVRVLILHSEGYPQLQSSTRRAMHNLITMMKERSVDRVVEMVEMEKLTAYTCKPEYVSTCRELMAELETFMEGLNDPRKPSWLVLDGFGEVRVCHLREFPTTLVQQAFDMKMRMTAYWSIVLQRLVDSLALHLLFSVQNLVNKEMEHEMVTELMEPHFGGIKRMLEEPPSMARKRDGLIQSINLLKESKEVVGKVMDRIVAPLHYAD